MDKLDKTLKCETIGGFLKEGYCHVDDFILKDTEVSCEETFKGKWVSKTLTPVESMHLLGTTKTDNFAEFRLCKFPLDNIDNLKKEYFDKLQFTTLMRVYNRNRFDKAVIDKKKELVNDSQFLNFLVDRAKEIVSSGQQHQPMLFIKSGKEITIATLIFENYDEKERILKNVRKSITDGNIKKYWIVMEAWTGDNPFILPSRDAERKEALIISEYEKGEIRGKQIHLPFDRDAAGKPIWKKPREMLGTETDMADRWNFFMEDTFDERMAKVRDEKLSEDIKKIKEQFMAEQQKKGVSKTELDMMSKTFDKVGEDIKKKMKRAYGDEKL